MVSFDTKQIKDPVLKAVIETLQKQYKDVDDLISCVDTERIGGEPAVKTGSVALDKAIGIGGVPKGRMTIIAGEPSTGKCHGKGTNVLMYDGTYKRVEDIKVGDLLMGADSTPRNVISTTSGYGKLYEVSSKSNHMNPYIVNEEHVLALKRNDHGKLLSENIPVKEFLKFTHWRKSRVKGYSVGVEFPKNNVSIDPYFLGLWLGDGHSANTRVTTCDKEVVEYLYELAASVGLQITVVNEITYGITTARKGGCYKRNPILNSLKEYNVLNNKHIPTEYKINSRENRLSLLAGLIDSDGHQFQNGQFEIVSKSITLANDIVFLARSLGYAVSIRKRIVNSVTYQKIFISGIGPELPSKLNRKKPKLIKMRTNPNHYSIQVKQIDDGEYYGFELDKDHLYLLEDFTVTHNSTLCMSIVKQSQMAEPDKINIYVDMEAGAFTAEYAYKMGIDIDPNKFLIIKPDYAEQGFVTIYNLIATGKVGVCVWDSLAGALTKEAKGNTAEDNDSRAGLARLLSNEMRRLAPLLGKTGTTMLMVNQIRTQMTMTLSWNDITGGRAQKFYASVRIDLAKKEKAKDFSGNLDRETIIAHVTKNKVAAPYKEAEFDVKFGEGIIAESNILDMATKEGIVSSSVNGWFSFPNLETGEEIFKVRTKSAATDYLVDNPDYCAALEEKLLGYSRVTEYEAEPTTDEDYDFKETEPKEEIMVAE